MTRKRCNRPRSAAFVEKMSSVRSRTLLDLWCGQVASVHVPNVPTPSLEKVVSGGAPRGRGCRPLPQATTPAPRWILHRCSPGTALLIEEHSGTMSLQER